MLSQNCRAVLQGRFCCILMDCRSKAVGKQGREFAELIADAPSTRS
jgi:hypothetical protein